MYRPKLWVYYLLWLSSNKATPEFNRAEIKVRILNLFKIHKKTSIHFITRKPKGLWHSCKHGSNPSKLNSLKF